MCGFRNILFLKGIMTFKVKESCIQLNKNIKFNKNETESKMKNPTHSFRETNQIKSKTVMSWNSRKKNEDIFFTVYFVRRNY